MTKVSIIILNWNRPDDTLECIESIKSLRVAGYELETIIVDNNSSDNSVRLLKELVYKTKHSARHYNIHLIENKANLGFAAGNNVGIRYALAGGADYIMVLNNDTLVHPDLIRYFIQMSKDNSKLGAASPKIYFEKGFEFHKNKYKKTELGNVIWYAGGEIDWANVYGKTRGVDEVDVGQYNIPEKTDFATGTCMFLSRTALEKSGLFNEKYYMYYEDTELSLRIKKAGFDVMYIPGAVVWHKVAQSSAIGGDLNDYFIARNRLLFGMRYAPLRTRFALYKESLRLLLNGREWQKRGVRDFYLRRFEKGSWR